MIQEVCRNVSKESTLEQFEFCVSYRLESQPTMESLADFVPDQGDQDVNEGEIQDADGAGIPIVIECINEGEIQDGNEDAAAALDQSGQAETEAPTQEDDELDDEEGETPQKGQSGLRHIACAMRCTQSRRVMLHSSTTRCRSFSHSE